MFSFYSDNLLKDATLSMIDGTENAQFPLANIKKTFTTKVFRSNEPSCSILIDLHTVRPVDSFLIVGNALGSLGFNSLKLYGSTVPNDFTASTEVVVDYSAKYNVGMVHFSNTQEFRYWKLEVQNTGAFCEISSLFIGEKLTLANNGLSGTTFQWSLTDLSKVSKNDYNQKFVDRLMSVVSISGDFKLLTKEEHDLVLSVYNTHGNHTPLWVCLDPTSCISIDGKWKYTGYFWITNDMVSRYVPPHLFDVPIQLEQVV